MFLVRSTYRMLAETKHRRTKWLEGVSESSNSGDQEAQWQQLWKIKVPSKLRIFAWRLAQASLPTGEVRHHRHMAVTAVCSVCGSAPDTWRHALLECNMSRAVWSLEEEDL